MMVMNDASCGMLTANLHCAVVLVSRRRTVHNVAGCRKLILFRNGEIRSKALDVGQACK